MRRVVTVLAATVVAVAASSATASAGITTSPAGSGLRISGSGGQTLAVVADAAGVTARSVGPGEVRLRVPGDRVALRVPAAGGWVGFGSRSDAVVRTGGEVLNRVEDGPFATQRELDVVSVSIPPWGLGRTRQSTYFPLPWAMAASGRLGVLVAEDADSTFALRRDGLTASVPGESEVELRLFEGPTPADVLRRFTASRLVGRQPPVAAPWVLGPWFQTGHQNTSPGEQGYADALRRADAPTSVAETHLRYLPCQANLGPAGAGERARTAAFRAKGFETVTYLNNEVCGDIPLGQQAAAQGALQRKADGSPYVFTAYVGERGPTPVAQFDFTAPAGRALWSSLADQTVRDGHSGFMEDYGEYTPPDAVSADGTPGRLMRNRYPVTYHRAGQRWADAQRRPIARFVRSGWTGVAPSAPIVWGGDPNTDWGFDGLRSAVRQGVGMGLSGISLWATDIGGFFNLDPEKVLTPELLARWIQVGATLGVMRTKAEGIGIQGLDARPQVWERPTLAIWRRYGKLRTQLYPYFAAAHEAYRRTGTPLLRHPLLLDPGDRASATSDGDRFGVGPDLFAAPVLNPGRRSVTARLPAGRWLPASTALRFERDGAFRVSGPARALEGRRSTRQAAPLDVLPLWIRAGALLPMLDPAVDTLSTSGADRDDVVRLADRDDELRVLAFPRGTTERRAGGTTTAARLRSVEGDRRWTFAVRGVRADIVRVEASFAGMRRPFVPRRVEGATTWSYDASRRVLRFILRTEDGGEVVVRGSGR